MGSLWLVADYIGRPRNSLPSLVLAAAVMMGMDPAIVGDVSFQLSFASMAGLALLTPRFQSLGRRLCGMGAEQRTLATFVVDSLSVTLGAVLATLPIVAFYFQQVSLMALPANLLVLPAVPFIMGAAALVAIVGLFAPPASQVLGWVAWLFLSYMIEVVESLGRVPFASVPVRVESAFVWGYYIVLGVGLWAASNRSRVNAAVRRAAAGISAVAQLGRRVPARFAVFSLVVVAALVWVAAFALPDGRLHVFFLDVGQGDAILVSTPSGRQILVDGGPSGGNISARPGSALPFWERTIDLILLTHPHEDHVGGLTDVLRRYEVKQVLESSAEYDSLPYSEWQGLVEDEGAGRTVAIAGQRIELGEGAMMEVLHPGYAGRDGQAAQVDDASVVLRIVCGSVSILLTGDIGTETERDLLDSGFDLAGTVLKVAHHGSDSSSYPEFLAGVDPQVAVISVGAGNRFGHPSREVVERLAGARVYRTDQQGTVELTTDGNRLWVKTER
jgi:competence protein ComEC